MEKPIISCDVSKGNSHIQGFIGLSNPTSDPFVVRHVKSELKQIKELAKSLEKQTHQKPVFVFEYTGIYHECILKYVKEIGLDQYAISPLKPIGKIFEICPKYSIFYSDHKKSQAGLANY